MILTQNGILASPMSNSRIVPQTIQWQKNFWPKFEKNPVLLPSFQSMNSRYDPGRPHRKMFISRDRLRFLKKKEFFKSICPLKRNIFNAFFEFESFMP